MKKWFAILLAMTMMVCMLSGCAEEDVDPWDNIPEVTSEPTEATESAEEAALTEYISSHSSEKVNFDGLTVSYAEKEIKVSNKTTYNDLDGMFVIGEEDFSTLDTEDPDAPGIFKRLIYKNISKSKDDKYLYHWSFFTDFDAEDTVMWLELDQLADYNGEATASINGVCLNTSFDDVLGAFGSPDYHEIALKDGDSVVNVRWDYPIEGSEDGVVSVIMCLTGLNGTDFENTSVYNLYVNYKNVKMEG